MSHDNDLVTVNVHLFCVFCQILQNLIAGVNLSRIAHGRGRDIVDVCHQISGIAGVIPAQDDVLVTSAFDKSAAVNVDEQRFFAIFRLWIVHMNQRLSCGGINLKIPLFFHLVAV